MKSEPGIRGESRIYLDNTRLGDLKKDDAKPILKTIIDYDVTQKHS